MKKLSKEEAVELLAIAHKQVKDYPTYRLGQALYNLLPKSTRDEYDQTKEDDSWYQTTSKGSAMYHFWVTFVE